MSDLGAHNDESERLPALRQSATYVLSFIRNEQDSFEINFEELSPPPLRDGLSRKDARVVVPTGSEWSNAVGWRSFFGIPLKKGNQDWYAVGVEYIKNHSERGAYPVVHAYFFHSTQKAKAAVSALLEYVSDGPFKSSYFEERGVIRIPAKSVDDYDWCEKWILKQTEYAYSLEKSLFFRTAMLHEDHLRQIEQARSAQSSFSLLRKKKSTASVISTPMIVGSPSGIESKLSSNYQSRIRGMKQIPSR